MKLFNIIVAMDKKNGIGRGGVLPWHLPADLRRFRKITCASREGKKNIIIMGRKTWESLPQKYRPLPKRINFILSRNNRNQEGLVIEDKLSASGEDVYVVNGFEHAMSIIETQLVDIAGDVYVIGGQQIFELVIDNEYCHKIYATHILHEFDCDIFFPPFQDKFKKITASDILYDSGIPFYFAEYLRCESSEVKDIS